MLSRSSRVAQSAVRGVIPREATAVLGLTGRRWFGNPGDVLPDTVPGLHKAIIPTYHFQKSLTNLPVPKLEETLEKYLDLTSPLVTAEEHAVTADKVAAFAKEEGPGLQSHLETFAKEHPETSYVASIWNDRYLTNRDSFPLNLTPQISWRNPPDGDPRRLDQAARSADLCRAAARFYVSLEREELEPDVFHTNPARSTDPTIQRLISILPESLSYYGMYFAGGYALDMSQYAHLFSSTRLPRTGADVLKKSGHVPYVVAFRGPRMYKVRLFSETASGLGPKGDPGCVPLSAAEIEAQFRAILKEPRVSYEKEPPVAALTGWTRDEWAHTRARMEQDPASAAGLRMIDEALFTITLDEAKPELSGSDTDPDTSGHEALSRAMLHGDCRNRWWDKSFNLIVCENGRAGIAWEHAWGDGVAVLNFFNEVHKAVQKIPARDPVPASTAERIEVPVDDATAADIAAACKMNDDRIARVDLNVYRSNSLNRSHVKDSKLGPDGLCQLVLQLAHWRAHRYVPSTYESASTAGFKHGRTETIRSATPQTLAVCKAFDDATVDDVARFKLVQEATARHGKQARECMMGKGVDRHLLALEHYAKEQGLTPALFDDKTWDVMCDIRLSTSTLSSPNLEGGGFGPVSDTSYGVGYGIEDHGMQLHIMSYGQGNDEFIKAVEDSCQDLQRCMEAGKDAGLAKSQE